MSEPEPPENVRVVPANGNSEIPLECEYWGKDQDGTHHWEAVLPAVFVPDIEDGFAVTMDKLPAHTVVGFRVAGVRDQWLRS